mmetsp:Transcript_72582/g.216633  ORF Transcript_72582/g.216633 Transcript_72582/m.216633 type:complete len:242 (+) Transcript_72582:570-1295(+)
MRKPPKIRPAVFRCCGMAVRVFWSVVSCISTSPASASVGIVRRVVPSRSSSKAADMPSSSKARPMMFFRLCSRFAFRAASRCRPSSKRAFSSGVLTRRELISAALPVFGSRATKVKLDSMKGMSDQLELACMLISMEDRPTKVTCPHKWMSSFTLGLCRYLMRSTLAVTMWRSSSSGLLLEQCPKAMVPARASRSSRRRPTRKRPQGLTYLSVNAAFSGLLNSYVTEAADSLGVFATKVLP